MSNLPVGIDICFNRKMKRYSKIMVLFMEDIEMEIREDANGGYLYVYRCEKYNRK